MKYIYRVEFVRPATQQPQAPRVQRSRRTATRSPRAPGARAAPDARFERRRRAGREPAAGGQRQGAAQRPVPVRQRQEVQEVPRRGGVARLRPAIRLDRQARVSPGLEPALDVGYPAHAEISEPGRGQAGGIPLLAEQDQHAGVVIDDLRGASRGSVDRARQGSDGHRDRHRPGDVTVLHPLLERPLVEQDGVTGVAELGMRLLGRDALPACSRAATSRSSTVGVGCADGSTGHGGHRANVEQRGFSGPQMSSSAAGVNPIAR